MSAESEPAAQWKDGDKRQFVMGHALDLLIDVGYQGLTMRGVAEKCGISLSNVQYYFRTKEDLIDAIADQYFGECHFMLANHFEAHGPIDNRAGLEHVVALFLDHGREMTDMCRVFRELWAISSRHVSLAKRLNAHYRRLGDTLSDNLQYPTASRDGARRAAAVLLILSEGYSIVGSTRMIDHTAAVQMVADILMKEVTSD